MPKKVLLFFLISLFSSSVFAQFVNVKPTAITIDGEKTDWVAQGLRPLITEVGDVKKGDLIGVNIKQLYMSFDEKYLYLFITHDEDPTSFIKEYTSGESVLQLFFEVDGKKNTGVTKYKMFDKVPLKNGSDRMITVNFDKNKAGNPDVSYGVRTSTSNSEFNAYIGNVAFTKESSRIKAKKGTIELKIPLANLGFDTDTLNNVVLIVAEHTNANKKIGYKKLTLDIKTAVEDRIAADRGPVVPIVIGLAFMLIWLVFWWLIFNKAGLNGSLAVLMVFPPAGFLFLATKKWPLHYQVEDLEEELEQLTLLEDEYGE